MHPKVEKLVMKHAASLIDYTEDSAIKNGAMFIENTLEENENSALSIEELTKFASNTYRLLHDSLPLVGIQVAERAPEGKYGENRMVGYAMRFNDASDDSSEIGEVSLRMEQLIGELENRKIKGNVNSKDKEEVLNLATYEVAHSMSRLTIKKLKELITEDNRSSWEYGKLPKFSKHEMKDGEIQVAKFRTLYTTTINGSESIARKTRRGAGNIYLTTPKSTVALQALPECEYRELDRHNHSAVSHVADLHGVKVLRDTFGYQEDGKDNILIGYKGTEQIDAGLLLLLHSIVVEDHGGVSVNYAFGSDDQAKDFYHMIDVDFSMVKKVEV